MRTERAVLFGTHFFCVLEWARFLHMGIRQIPLLPLNSALLLQCQSETIRRQSQ